MREQIMGMIKAGSSVNKVVTKQGCHRSTVYRIQTRAIERKGDLSTKEGAPAARCPS